MKIYYKHYRVRQGHKQRKGPPPVIESYRRGQTDWIPMGRGGLTSCTILSDDNNKILAHGKALCSMSDNFNYKIGRDIARGRAEKQLQ